MSTHKPEISGSATRPRAPTSWFFSIQARVFLAMASLAAILLLMLSYWIEQQARREMEQELTLKLQAVGGAAVSLVGPGLVPALTSLSPAQAGFPFYLDRRMALSQLRDRTGVRRIFLADTAGRSFVDTDPRVGIASPLPQLRSDRTAIAEVLGGRPSAAALFTDDEGRLRKTGYVPVLQGGDVIGVLGVEGDATFLSAVRKLRARILTLGAVGIVLAFLLAAPVARGLTRPLNRLVDWARRFGDGDLERPVPVRGRDEIAFLGRTLEQMRQRLSERDREQRAMVAGVAHEIRNPLGGMRLYAELLSEDPALAGSARDRLGKILRELNHLSAIVEEFLLFARPEEAHPEPVRLEEAVRELVDWIRPVAGAKSVRVESGGSGGAVVACDPTHLRQILRNLIQNAVDASPEGGSVRVTVQKDPSGVRAEVEDQGPGIPAESRERVFEPFYTTKATGAGLGLAIVRRLASLNAGRVAVETPERGGARFVLVLPEGR